MKRSSRRRKTSVMPKPTRLSTPPPMNPIVTNTGTTVHQRMLNITDRDRVDFMIWLDSLWGSECGDLVYMTLHNLRDNAIRASREKGGDSSDMKLGVIQGIDMVIEALENYKHDGQAAKQRLAQRTEPDPDAQFGVEGGEE